MNESDDNKIKDIYRFMLKYTALRLDYARLTVAEKLAVLLATVAFYAIAVVIGMVTLVFVSIGIGHLLASTIAPHTAYLLVSAVYLILFVVLITFRKKLIFNPTARFVSRLLLKDPDDNR